MKRVLLLFAVLLLTGFGCDNLTSSGDGAGAGDEGSPAPPDGGSSPPPDDGSPSAPQWSAAYAFDGLGDFTLEDTFSTSDGGQVFVGWSSGSSADALLLKVDEDGAPLWARRLDAAGDELATTGVEAPDGDLIVAGIAAEATNQLGLLMLRLSAEGALQRAYAVDMTELVDFPEAIFVDEGDLLVVGNLMNSSLTDAEDAFVYRVGAIPANIVQADGGVYETFDVNNNSATHVFDAVLHEDELLLAVSTDTNDPGSTTDAALISLRPELDGSPSRLPAVLGTETSFPRGDDRFTDLRVLSDGDVLAVGTTDSFTPSVRDTDVWAARLTYDENDSMTPWDSVWQRLYMGSDDDRARSLVATTDGYAIIGATMSYGAGGSDAWVLEIDPEGSVQDQYALGGSLDEEPVDVVAASGGGFILAGETASFSPPSRPAHVWAVRGTAALGVPDSLRSDSDATVSATSTAVRTMLTQLGDERKRTTIVEIDLSSLISTPISVASEQQ